MFRTHLMGAASAAAIACLAVAAHAQTPTQLVGSGSTLAFYDYNDEFNTFNATVAGTPNYAFRTYIANVGSGTGQQAFIRNDYTCATSRAATGTATCTTGGGANTVHYGASDATLSATQLSTWATGAFGQSAAGNLIQLPTIGVGISFPVKHAGVTKNGQFRVTDHDLCEIFSGGYTNFNQITDVSPANAGSGAITVVYRSDGSGTTFILTSHLASACTPGTDTPGTFSFKATTSFASLFSTVPSNFTGASGNGGVATNLTGQTEAFSYLSPDFTSVITTSKAGFSLVVAGVFQPGATTTNKYVIPTAGQVKTGLANPNGGVNLTPPTNATDGADPNKWVPVIAATTNGYPVVGYTTIDFAQCYADAKVTTGVKNFLKVHYAGAGYKTIQANNGFVPLSSSAAGAFVTTISKNILANANTWNTDIGNTTACAGKAGR